MFKPRQAPSAVPATPPAIEVVRQRAKQRLIGASLLVLAGVLVFPVLFDTQPRPIPVDIRIEIPSRQNAKTLSQPAEPTGVAKPSVQPIESIESATQAEPARAASKPADLSPAPEKTATEPKLEPKVAVKTETKAPVVPPVAPNVKESERAQALLEGRAAAATAPAAGGERFIVQVGAFAENALAQQVRLKLERAGMKTYTHVADTPEGKRIRVRLGPFSSRAEADKAASKAKGLGLATAVLTL